jgi:hypothetical protein
MRLLKFIFVAVYCILVIPSTTAQPAKSNLKASEITDLQHFEPFCYISLIDSGNIAKLNDTLSLNSKELLIKVEDSFSGRIPETGEISVSDTTIKHKLEKEIQFLCLSAERQKNISNLKITPVIDSLLETNGKRFGLITVCTGFTRAKGNLAKQITKSTISGLLLGVSRDPIKANSTLYALIVDAKENNIAYFRKSSLIKEPLEEKILLKQFEDIFEGYFWPKN